MRSLVCRLKLDVRNWRVVPAARVSGAALGPKGVHDSVDLPNKEVASLWEGQSFEETAPMHALELAHVREV